jgi:hypothetical protein
MQPPVADIACGFETPHGAFGGLRLAIGIRHVDLCLQALERVTVGADQIIVEAHPMAGHGVTSFFAPRANSF